MAAEGEIQLPTGDSREPTANEFADLQNAMSESGLNFGDDSSTKEPSDTPDPGVGEEPPANNQPVVKDAPKPPPQQQQETPPEEPPATPEPKADEGGELPPDPEVTPPVGEDEDAEVDALQIAETAPDGVKQLRTVARERGKQIKELQGQVKDLITKSSQKRELSPEMQERIDRADAIYASLALQDSPEFKAKYDDQIESNNGLIMQTFQQIGVSGDSIKEMQGRIEASGGDMLKAFPWSWWKEHVFGNEQIPELQREQMKTLLSQNNLLQTNRDAELAGKLKNFKQVGAEERERMSKWAQGQQTEIQSMIEEIRPQVPWANEKEVPAGATPQQVKEITKHNELAKATAIRFEAHLFPKTNKSRVYTAALASWAPKLSEDLKAAYRMVDALKGEIQRLKKPGQMNKRPAAIPQTPSVPVLPKDNLEMPSEQAITAGLDAALGRKG